MWLLFRLPADKDEPEEILEGPSQAIVNVKSITRRVAAIVGLFIFTALTFAFVTDAFVESIRTIADSFLIGLLGSGAVFFSIQWIAPVLSAFHGTVTALNVAPTIPLAPT